ncbi:barstar family protein [Amycolatopsis orientalis]|uniref:barstar family protein n=1 Tax=Amycolatopsis orientalis TaxID=31958 RepID=UPI00056AB5E3|nr:barstar family protein [Amycolatopsis orientalis]
MTSGAQARSRYADATMDEIKPGLSVVAELDLGELTRHASREGFRVLVLSGVGPGKKSFFDQVETQLPTDPPLGKVNVWDALADSLWEGMRCLPEHKLLLVWLDSKEFADNSPDEFAVALSVLRDLTDIPMCPDGSPGQRKSVAIFVAATAAPLKS